MPSQRVVEYIRQFTFFAQPKLLAKPECHKPNIDLTASYGMQRNPQGSTVSTLSSRSNSPTIGWR